MHSDLYEWLRNEKTITKTNFLQFFHHEEDREALLHNSSQLRDTYVLNETESNGWMPSRKIKQNGKGSLNPLE